MKKKKNEIFRIVAENPGAGIKPLYENYGRNLYSYGIKSWHLSEDECWEVVYKTIYKVAEKTRVYRFTSEEDYRSFIFKVFINFLKNHFKSKEKEKEKFLRIDLEEIRTPPVPVDEIQVEAFSGLEESTLMGLLKDELDKMQDWERILLLMRCQDFSYNEITKYVNKPAGQLKVYYQRLKNSLLKKLEQKEVIKKENSDEKR